MPEVNPEPSTPTTAQAPNPRSQRIRKLNSSRFGRFLNWILGRSYDNDLDDEFLESYRNLLFGQYRSLTGTVIDSGAKNDADEIIKKGEDVEWEDLYRLELDIVKLESLPQLRRRVWILRNEYQEIASVQEIKDYYASKPPDPDGASVTEADLRADCIRLQEELNWRYVVIWVLEEFRGRLVRKVIKWGVGFGVVVFAIWTCSLIPAMGISSWYIKLPSLAMILVPGFLGGLFSTLRRIQKTPLDGNADLTLTQLEQGSNSVVLSPFLGSMFAFLAFALIAGNFFNGSLFPKVGFEQLWGEGGKELDYGEVPKLIIWCFVAGFSEKFVPDRLDRLADQASKDK